MADNKTHFIVEEHFKSDDEISRLTALQNIFLKIISTYELTQDTSFLDTPCHTKENPHE